MWFRRALGAIVFLSGLASGADAQRPAPRAVSGSCLLGTGPIAPMMAPTYGYFRSGCTETAVVINAETQRLGTIPGSPLTSARRTSGPAPFSPVPAARVDTLRRAFQRWMQISSRPDRIAGFGQIIAVLSAQTQAEFHSRIRQLPVDIAVRYGRNAVGREGTWKEFTHRSGRGRRVAIFTASNGGPVDGQNTRSETTEASSEPFVLNTENSILAIAVPQSNFCEYWDAENVYYSGECATSQEVEDAAIMLAASEAEAEAYQEEVDEAVNEYCQMMIVPDPPDEDYIEMCGDPGLRLTAAETHNRGGLYPAFADMPEADDGLSALISAPMCALDHCGARKVAFGISIANFVGRAVKLGHVVHAASTIWPPAAPVLEATYWTGVAIAGVGLAAYLVVDCTSEH